MKYPERSELNFHKSSYSSNGGSCVEIAANGGQFYVGDTKDPSGPLLAFSFQDMRAFTTAVRDEKF